MVSTCVFEFLSGLYYELEPIAAGDAVDAPSLEDAFRVGARCPFAGDVTLVLCPKLLVAIPNLSGLTDFDLAGSSRAVEEHQVGTSCESLWPSCPPPSLYPLL